MTYKGKYKLKKPKKYKGDPNSVTYRSHWERQVFRWCETNSNVEWWSSEELVIPYRCATDNKNHRYFVDVVIKFKDIDEVRCVEIKPKAQTEAPKKSKGKTRQRLLQEGLTYAKNVSKWNAAQKFCEKRGWRFEIWTEDTLQSLGISLLLKR